MKRLSLAQFGKIVQRVMTTLPPEFETYLDNLVVDVEDEPDERTLSQAGFTAEEIAEGDSLYGLFVPFAMPGELEDIPHRILIFKRPLEEDFPSRRQLIIEIRKTVIHELAHHFGFTERDLERFDATPDPFQGSTEFE